MTQKGRILTDSDLGRLIGPVPVAAESVDKDTTNLMYDVEGSSFGIHRRNEVVTTRALSRKYFSMGAKIFSIFDASRSRLGKKKMLPTEHGACLESNSKKWKACKTRLRAKCT